MIHRFLPEAIDELLQAVHYLDAKAGLGDALYDEINSAIAVIKAQPDQWPVVIDTIRRYRLSRFKYHVVYEMRGEVLVIIAVQHTSRRPGYWRNRV